MAPFGQCLFGTAVTTLFHPIAYAKVLIQVGTVSSFLVVHDLISGTPNRINFLFISSA